MQEDKKGMQKEQFINLVSERLQTITGCEIKVNQVAKNNGVVLNAIVIMREGKNTFPTIYLEQFYDDFNFGEPIEEIVDRILQLEEEHQISSEFDVSDFLDFYKIKSNLYYRIINYDSNSERLKNIPHKKILDLAKVYYLEVENEEIGTGTILVTNNFLVQWNVSPDEIDIVATRNTETKLQPSVREMSEVLKENIYKEFGDGEQEVPELTKIDYPCMYVVTNKKGTFGASTLIYNNLLKIIAEEVEDDLVIFPSSIYEFLFMPASIVERDYQELKEMVKSINDTSISREEFLSNNVYFYDRTKDKLQIAE